MSRSHRWKTRARAGIYAHAIELQKRGLLWPTVIALAIVAIILLILAWPIIWMIIKYIFYAIVAIALLIMLIMAFASMS